MATAADDGTVWARWTRDLIEAAAARGVDPAPLWSLTTLDPDSDSDDERVPERIHLAVWEAAMAAAHDPGFPVEHGASIAFDRNLLGLACKTADVVREALDRLAQYLPLWNDRYQCTKRPLGDGRVEIALQGPLGGLGRRCVNEVAVAGLVAAIRQCTRDDVNPRAVHFRHPQPTSTDAHTRFFRAPLQFGSTWDGVVLDAATLELELTLADPELNRFFARELERLEAEQPEPSLENRARRAITQSLPGGTPKIAAIAHALGSSVRSLQRHLAAADTSIAELIDDVRRDIAIAMVTTSTTPLGEISFLLGFSEPSAFHRAFKRWTGQTAARARAGGAGH